MCHSITVIILFYFTYYLWRTGRFLTKWSWFVFAVYFIAMIWKINGLLAWTNYVQYNSDCPLLTSLDEMQPVCTAFAVDAEVALILFTLLFYTGMGCITLYLVYQAGKHKRIITIADRYKRFAIVD